MRGAFCDAVVAPNLAQGLVRAMQLSGMGRLRPNTVMLGYMNDWEEKTMASIHTYERMIFTAVESGRGVVILRDNRGMFGNMRGMVKRELISKFFSTKTLEQIDEAAYSLDCGDKVRRALGNCLGKKGDVYVNEEDEQAATLAQQIEMGRGKGSSPGGDDDDDEGEEDDTNEKTNIGGGTGSKGENKTKYGAKTAEKKKKKKKKKRKEKYIDVWWIFNDGGLTALLSYLITKARSSPFKDHVLRINVISENLVKSRGTGGEDEGGGGGAAAVDVGMDSRTQRLSGHVSRMAHLLEKLRIKMEINVSATFFL